MRILLVWLTLILVVYVTNGLEYTGEGEPKCYSRFDYDYKLMLKLVKLEERQETMQGIIAAQSKQIGDLEEKLKGSLQQQWGSWGSWGDCFMNCTGKHGGRLQSRSRQQINEGSDADTETETRPCNAVQFAGCVKDFGQNDNYGVTYDFADQIAVSTCTAIKSESGNYVYAVRRTCAKPSVTCDERCKHLGLTCFNSLHVHKNNPVLKRGQENTNGLYLYRYNHCTATYCGPNFCCCYGRL